MSRYVDGFVLPVPKDNMAGRSPRSPGREARKQRGCGLSWILYESRERRDEINAKVMADPRLAEMMDPKNLPFDGKRMFWGGFKTIVEL